MCEDSWVNVSTELKKLMRIAICYGLRVRMTVRTVLGYALEKVAQDVGETTTTIRFTTIVRDEVRVSVSPTDQIFGSTYHVPVSDSHKCT